MSGHWWRRNAVALAVAPLVLGAAFWVAGRPLVDIWTEDDGPDRTVAITEPFTWETGTFELRSIEQAPHPLDEDGDPFEPPPGTIVWRTAWQASGPDEQTGSGCLLQLVDTEGRRFGSDPTELNRLGAGFGCAPDFEVDPASYRFVRYFLLPAGAEPAVVRFGGAFHEVVAITLS